MIYPLIAPSILAADLLNLEWEVSSITHAGADWIHIDIMDGNYVPNLSFGPQLVRALKEKTSLPLDVHLMVQPARSYIEMFANAGATHLTIHPDADIHIHRTLGQIRQYHLKAGVALNPATPLCVLDYLMSDIDLILMMTVNPGFGGQLFLKDLLEKIKAVRKKIDDSGHPISLQVDGGITVDTSRILRELGVDILVVGSSLFQQGSHNYSKIITELRGK